MVAVRNNDSFHFPEFDGFERAFQAAAASDVPDDNWSVSFYNEALQLFLFCADFVVSHGVTQAVGETDVNAAHEALLGELAPIAGELPEFIFGFFKAHLLKYVG